MTNDVWGAFIAGIAFSAVIAGIFQIGINIGLNTCIKMLEGNYPAAMHFLIKHKSNAKVLPYVIASKE